MTGKTKKKVKKTAIEFKTLNIATTKPQAFLHELARLCKKFAENKDYYYSYDFEEVE